MEYLALAKGFLVTFGPVTGVIVVIVLAFASLAYKLLSRYGNRRMDILAAQQSVLCPRFHRFFALAEQYATFRLEEMRIVTHGKYCTVRTQIFKDMLRMKFSCWQKTLQQAVDYIILNNVKEEQVGSVMCRSVSGIVAAYSKAWESAGIPQIVADKFHGWHLARARVLAEQTEQVAASHCYSSVTERLNAILELHCAMLVSTVLDAENTIVTLNGELTGIAYGDKIIE